MPLILRYYLIILLRCAQQLNTHGWNSNWSMRPLRPFCFWPWPYRDRRPPRPRPPARGPPRTCWWPPPGFSSRSCGPRPAGSRPETTWFPVSDIPADGTRISTGCRRPPVAVAASAWNWVQSLRPRPSLQSPIRCRCCSAANNNNTLSIVFADVLYWSSQ